MTLRRIPLTSEDISVFGGEDLGGEQATLSIPRLKSKV